MSYEQARKLKKGEKVFVDFGPLTGQPRPDYTVEREILAVAKNGMIQVQWHRGKKCAWISPFRVLKHDELSIS